MLSKSKGNPRFTTVGNPFTIKEKAKVRFLPQDLKDENQLAISAQCSPGVHQACQSTISCVTGGDGRSQRRWQMHCAMLMKSRRCPSNASNSIFDACDGEVENFYNLQTRMCARTAQVPDIRGSLSWSSDAGSSAQRRTVDW